MTISTSSSSYIFECCCGERFNNVVAASHCKKCRNYSVWGYTRYVVNTLTEEVVYGDMPSDEEYAEATAAAEQRWAREQAEWQQLQEEDAQHRCDELAEEIRQEWWDQLDAEEELWDIQDRLSK